MSHIFVLNRPKFTNTYPQSNIKPFHTASQYNFIIYSIGNIYECVSIYMFGLQIKTCRVVQFHIEELLEISDLQAKVFLIAYSPMHNVKYECISFF